MRKDRHVDTEKMGLGDLDLTWESLHILDSQCLLYTVEQGMGLLHTVNKETGLVSLSGNSVCRVTAFRL